MDCFSSAGCKLKGRCLVHPDGYCAGPDSRGIQSGAQARFVSAAQPLARGFRVHHCDEPIATRPTRALPLRPAGDVRARRAGQAVWLDPLGLRILVPNVAACSGGSTATVMTDPSAFGLPPGLDSSYRAREPFWTALYGALLPVEAQFLKLEVATASRCIGETIESPSSEVTVSYFAVQEPVAEVVARLEPVLIDVAQAQGCSRRGQRMRQRARAAFEETEWLDGAWAQWRDEWGAWRRVGGLARWSLGAMHESWVELFVQRVGDRTLLVALNTSTSVDSVNAAVLLRPDEVPTALLLPSGGRPGEESFVPIEGASSTCPLSRVDDIHFALRPGPTDSAHP
jgi:hypothetical protein